MKNKSAIVKEMYIKLLPMVIFLAFVAILISIVLLLFTGTVAKLLGAPGYSGGKELEQA
ncbi:MAG: hypothetical protein K6F55_00280 [Eubacterium sp.]|nr:hypothetical protein [Eubacterium sp.]